MSTMNFFNLSSFTHGLYNLSGGEFSNTGVQLPHYLNNSPRADGRGGNWGLSALDNSVQLLNTGRIGGSPVVGVLFNYKGGNGDSPNSAPVTARTMRSPDHATHNTHIRLDSDYHNNTFALVALNGMTVTYTGKAGTMLPVASGFNLVVGPDMRRKVQMGYI